MLLLQVLSGHVEHIRLDIAITRSACNEHRFLDATVFSWLLRRRVVILLDILTRVT